MACVNTNPIFGCAGVWNIGDGGQDRPAKQPLIQALNVVGWFPVISVISGIVNNYFGFAALINGEDLRGKQEGAVTIVRGLFQICQLGILFAPVDIACSCIRSYREWKKNQSDLKTA